MDYVEANPGGDEHSSVLSGLEHTAIAIATNADFRWETSQQSKSWHVTGAPKQFNDFLEKLRVDQPLFPKHPDFLACYETGITFWYEGLTNSLPTPDPQNPCVKSGRIP
jgi:hypothetical protein